MCTTNQINHHIFQQNDTPVNNTEYSEYSVLRTPSTIFLFDYYSYSAVKNLVRSEMICSADKKDICRLSIQYTYYNCVQLRYSEYVSCCYNKIDWQLGELYRSLSGRWFSLYAERKMRFAKRKPSRR
jgi:hypothetical protein